MLPRYFKKLLADFDELTQALASHACLQTDCVKLPLSQHQMVWCCLIGDVFTRHFRFWKVEEKGAQVYLTMAISSTHQKRFRGVPARLDHLNRNKGGK